MKQTMAGGEASIETTAGKERRVFTGRVVGSIVEYSIVSAICLMWLVTLVIIPMLTTRVEFTEIGIASLGFDILITVLILLAVVHSSLDLITNAALGIRKPDKSKVKFKRFSINQRIQHVWLLTTTAVSALTGFSLLYIDSWGDTIVKALGGYETTLDIHYLSAILMGSLVAYHFAFYASKYLANRALGLPARLDVIFSKKDAVDFVASFKYYLGKGEKPKINKYSYAQRFDYFGVYWGMIILGAPGLMMWALGMQAYGGLAYIFHVKEALLAVLFLGVFHIYHNHFNPREFPIDTTFITGTVSEQEMAEEHPLELARLTGLPTEQGNKRAET